VKYNRYPFYERKEKRRETGYTNIRLQVFMAMKVETVVFWVVASCLADGYQHFRGTYCLRLHNPTTRMEAIGSSKMVLTTYKTEQCHNPEDYNMKTQLVAYIKCISIMSVLTSCDIRLISRIACLWQAPPVKNLLTLLASAYPAMWKN
jgi:hypothetical protein